MSEATCVVHGWWSLPEVSLPAASLPDADQGRLLLWAEDATSMAAPPRRRDRRPRVQPHPFALGAEELAEALDLGRGEFRSGEETEALLRLPGYPHSPLASPQLLDLGANIGAGVAEGEQPRHRDDVRWRVPALALNAEEAAHLLLDLPAPGSHTPVQIGSDLRSLSWLVGFAAELVRRGRTLPVALPGKPPAPGRAPAPAAGSGHGIARWRPVVTGPDADWLRSAAGALPACYEAGLEPGDRIASVTAALDDLTDALVRLRLVSVTRRPAAATGLAAWRAALRGPDARFPATAVQLNGLRQAIVRWQSDAAGGSAVRACFRLVEPRDDDETSVLRRPDAVQRSAEESAMWRVDLGLQLADEPSHFITADSVWAGTVPPGLTRHGRPPELLLGELGRAVRLYPELAVAMAGARPCDLLLDTVQAHEFLADAAPLLIGAGFGVQLPGWWTASKARVGARLRAGTSGQPGRVEGTPAIGQEHLVEFDWRLSIGEHVLSEPEIESLIAANRPLVRMRGEWLQVDPDRLRKARDFLRRKRNAGGMTVGDVLRVIGSDDEGPGGLPVTGVDAAGWLAELLTPSADQRFQNVPVPAGFVGTLRPYQERGLSWLGFLDSTGMGGVLADDMGLGKTIQLLALIARDLQPPDDHARRDSPSLLVCPMSLVGNWEREAAKFVPALKLYVHHGPDRPRGEAFDSAVGAADLVVTTYALLARDASLFRERHWRRVVLDEAQAVKNAATQASVVARSLNTTARIAVTGTPVENRLADLWSLMEFANPRLLGDASAFKRRFALPIERVGDALAAERLRKLTGPFVLRRLKTDKTIIDDLPPKIEMDVACTLTAEQAALYRSVVDDMLDRISDSSGIERRGLVISTMTKLKQVCNHPAQFMHDGSRVPGRSGKLERLEEVVEQVLAAGEKVLVFTQFASFGEMLTTHLSATFGREVGFLHGGLDKKRRDELVSRFQGEGPGHTGGPPIFVLSLKAGGTGLNLTAANHVIHVDRWWNPAVEDQATDRAFRIGQDRTVQVRTFVTAGTLEEKIGGMIDSKRALASSVVGSGEQWLTELSTDQLRELITLDASAVVT